MQSNGFHLLHERTSREVHLTLQYSLPLLLPPFPLLPFLLLILLPPFLVPFLLLFFFFFYFYFFFILFFSSSKII
jgi:hypothetical protein